MKSAHQFGMASRGSEEEDDPDADQYQRRDPAPGPRLLSSVWLVSLMIPGPAGAAPPVGAAAPG